MVFSELLLTPSSDLIAHLVGTASDTQATLGFAIKAVSVVDKLNTLIMDNFSNLLPQQHPANPFLHQQAP